MPPTGRLTVTLPPHLRLRLGYPKPHVRIAVHRRRGRKVLPRLVAFARSPVEPGEGQVTVGDMGAQVEEAPVLEGCMVVGDRLVERGSMSAQCESLH